MAQKLMRRSLVSPDSTAKMVVQAQAGKSGWNFHVSIKTGAEKAVTGARAKFEDEAQAKSALDKVVLEAESRGWKTTSSATSKKDAFTEIPMAPGFSPKPTAIEQKKVVKSA